MITRRRALGTGLVLATAASSGALGAVATGRRTASRIDAFLVDRTIGMPKQMAAFIAISAPKLPVVGIDLDAAAHAGLMRVLARSSALVGLSSGATLFCLERLAWSHGFRLTQRSARPVSDARWQDVASLMNGHYIAPDPTNPTRSFAPSRADGMLHSWLMQKPADARSGQKHGARS